ncbi:MAG: polysaccharide biosynthesis/export family protein [Acidobacteria bacterium]|nr:polysaccharide biosynthesis/export family protein [Acidobacteriota bacterium]
MKLLRITLLLLLMTCSVALPGQNSDSGNEFSEIPEDFVIGLEDTLAVSVWREPELSVKEVMVRPDGKISLPLIGDVVASGLTTKQLQESVTEKYTEYVSNPTVSVVILRIASLTVTVQGQVAKPGVYYLGSPMTVLELLARAGGLREYADEKDIAIIRKEGKKKFFRFNYKDVSKGKNLQQNITLQNGDIIIVPGG